MAGLFSAERSGLDIPSKKESPTWPAHWVPVPVHAPIAYSKDRVSYINIIQLPIRLYNFGVGVSGKYDSGKMFPAFKKSNAQIHLHNKSKVSLFPFVFTLTTSNLLFFLPKHA